MSSKPSKIFRVLKSPQRHSRSVAEKVEICLPSIPWTPVLIEDIARLLADAAVRDSQQYPAPQSKKAS